MRCLVGVLLSIGFVLAGPARADDPKPPSIPGLKHRVVAITDLGDEVHVDLAAKAGSTPHGERVIDAALAFQVTFE